MVDAFFFILVSKCDFRYTIMEVKVTVQNICDSSAENA